MPIQHKEPLLFTPGPLTTSQSVKQASLQDMGSRDHNFQQLVSNIRASLLAVDNFSEEIYTSILLSGSGTTAVESVLSSTIDENDHLLVLSNGAYGKRIADIATTYHLPHQVLEFPEKQAIDCQAVKVLLKSQTFSHIVFVHCETTTGLINPLDEIIEIGITNNAIIIVDAMSSFGGIPIDNYQNRIDYLISSANKCLQGIPGSSFVIAKKIQLMQSKKFSKTFSLNLFQQWQTLEEKQQFRFTPPIQSLLALQQALIELEQEGGVPRRFHRYTQNSQQLAIQMTQLGFEYFLDSTIRGPIIHTFKIPENPAFNLDAMYHDLKQQGLIIYPGKITHEPTFRIGTIGHIFLEDIQCLIRAITNHLVQKNITISNT